MWTDYLVTLAPTEAPKKGSNLFLVALISILLFFWTCLMCYIPIWIRMSQSQITAVGALGAGLMVGAAFCVVIPESIEDAIESMDKSVGHMKGYHLVGLCITCGFCLMMIVDSLTHQFCGHGHDHDHGHGHSHGHDHGHDHAHEHKEGEKCDHDHGHAVVGVVKKPEVATPLLEGEETKKKEVASRHPYQATVWGLCFHSIFDGVAIGVTLLSEDPVVVWVIFAAIALHKSSAAFGLGSYFKKLGLSMKESESSCRGEGGIR